MIVYYCLLLFGSVHISTYQYIISIHINTSHMYDIFGVSVKKRGASPCWRGPTSGPSWGSAHVGDRHSRTWGRDAGHCLWNRIMTHLDPWKILSHDMYVYIYTCIHMYMYITCIYVYMSCIPWPNGMQIEELCSVNHRRSFMVLAYLPTERSFWMAHSSAFIGWVGLYHERGRHHEIV